MAREKKREWVDLGTGMKLKCELKLIGTGMEQNGVDFYWKFDHFYNKFSRLINQFILKQFGQFCIPINYSFYISNKALCIFKIKKKKISTPFVLDMHITLYRK